MLPPGASLMTNARAPVAPTFWRQVYETLDPELLTETPPVLAQLSIHILVLEVNP